MKVHQILPGLYQRGHTDHLCFRGKAQAISTLGVTSAVNLWTKPDIDLAALLDYRHHPIPDGGLSDETAALLQALSQEIAASLSRGHGWLIQCHAGRNRSGLLSALVVRRVLRVPGAQALAHVRAHRPRAVDNDAFSAFLCSLEAP